MAGRHLILYDGVCGLCNRLVQFVLPRDTQHVFDFASLQSVTGRAWLQRFARNPDDLNTFVVVTDYRTESPAMLVKARAALFVMRLLGQPWRSFVIFRALPDALLNVGYDLVARNRYRMFGRTDVCVLPRPEQRQRFIDV